MGIVRFALNFPYTFYVLAALILFLGVSAIIAMPDDIFPEIDIPVVSVVWQYTGLSTPELEQRVTTYSQYSIAPSVNRHQGHGIADPQRHFGTEDLFPTRRQSRLGDLADRCRVAITSAR